MSRMQEQIVGLPPTTFAGINVGKDALDIFIHPAGVRLKVKNGKPAIQGLIKALGQHGVELVAMEATGKYHRLAHAMLHDARIPVAVINLLRSGQFTDSIGKLTKTYTIDAQSLALPPTAPPDVQSTALREFSTTRRQVLDEIGDLKRQMHPAGENPLDEKDEDDTDPAVGADTTSDLKATHNEVAFAIEQKIDLNLVKGTNYHPPRPG